MKVGAWECNDGLYSLSIKEDNAKYLGAYATYAQSNKTNEFNAVYYFHNLTTRTKNFAEELDARRWCEGLARGEGVVILTETQKNFL